MTMKTLNEIYASVEDGGIKNRTFAAFEDSTLTYGQLGNRIKQVSAIFEHRGLKSGDRMLICSESDEAVILFTIAAIFNGITCIILPPEIKPSRGLALANRARPDLIIADEGERAAGFPDFEIYKIKKKKADVKGSLLQKFAFNQQKSTWLDDIAEFGEEAPSLDVSPEQVAFIHFTSGTTAAPKGVQLTFRNLLSHLETLGKQFGYDENSRILNNLMLSHVDGMFHGPIVALYHSASVYRPCDMDARHIEKYLNTVHREEITHAITVPTALSFIDKLAQYDDYFETDNFECVISSASILNIDLWERLEQRFGIRICNVYGLTETVVGGIFCGPDTETFRRGTVGKPVDIDIRIQNGGSQPVKTGEEGELWLKGDNIFSGYFEDESATMEAFDDGWFKTGDIAKQDADGFVDICGRSKELIISGGFNIHPAEVNEALLKDANVEEVATIGESHPDWQEIAVSAVVRNNGSDANESDVIDASREWLEERKVPKKIVFVDEIPKGDSGKVQIEKLRQMLAERATKRAQDFTEEKFFELVAGQLKVNRDELSMASRVGEVPGWDSFGHLNLVLAVEQTANVTLQANEIMSIVSLNDLWSIVRKNGSR